VRVTDRVLPLLIWQIFQTILYYLSLVVSKNQILPSFESLMDDDSIVYDELSLLVFNIKREVINVLDSFLSFLKVYDIRKSYK
jgi:hypothetical protein